MVGGRRRTDAPDGLWGGAPAEPGHAPAGSEAPQRIPRSRLPLPPVPGPAGGPRTSAAPFQAVPAPELPGGPTGDGRLSAPLEHASRVPARTSGPLIPRPARGVSTWPDDEPALVSTGPGSAASGARASAPAQRLPRPSNPAGVPSPAYGDWTKPSRDSGPLDLDFSAEVPRPMGLRMPAAPETSMIPERFESAEFDAPPSEEFDGPLSDEFPARGAMTGPGTGPVGGRAAMRAQRQAADMARRKAAKRSGEPVGVPEDEVGTERRPRRVLMGLIAMAVVALGVLGVYTVMSPETQEAASGSGQSQSSASDAAPTSPVLPPLETGDLELDLEPSTPEAAVGAVTAPVTVLNATDINGLAARVAETFAGAGWETPGVGTYVEDDITVPTVFYTPGDENQRLAAESLKSQFPQLQAVGERTFEVPADVTAPGLVVVLTADWP